MPVRNLLSIIAISNEITNGGKSWNITDFKKDDDLKSEIKDNIITRLNEPMVSQIKKTIMATYSGAPKWKQSHEIGSAKKRIADIDMENNFMFPTAWLAYTSPRVNCSNIQAEIISLVNNTVPSGMFFSQRVKTSGIITNKGIATNDIIEKPNFPAVSDNLNILSLSPTPLLFIIWGFIVLITDADTVYM